MEQLSIEEIKKQIYECRNKNIENKIRINKLIEYKKDYYSNFNIEKFEDIKDDFFDICWKKDIDNFSIWSKNRKYDLDLKNLYNTINRNKKYINVYNKLIHKEKGTQEKWDSRKLKRIIKVENTNKKRERL